MKIKIYCMFEGKELIRVYRHKPNAKAHLKWRKEFNKKHGLNYGKIIIKECTLNIRGV